MALAHQEFQCSLIRVGVPSKFLLAAAPLGASRRAFRLVIPFLGRIVYSFHGMPLV
jgi:hypothetical protein